MVEQTAQRGTATEAGERLEQRAARSMAEFETGLERIARIARGVVDGRYGSDELRHLQRQLDRSVQELDGLAESSRYLTVHLWDPPPGAESGSGADVDDLRRVRVRMLWPVPRARDRLLVSEKRDAADVLDRVTVAQHTLRSSSLDREPGADSPVAENPWRLEDESSGVRAMVLATRAQLEALERLLRRSKGGVVVP